MPSRVDGNEGPPLPAVSRGARILLVEDEANIRFLMASILRDCGYQVLEASNGRAAFELLRCQVNTLQLLITDLGLPGLGGRELIREVASACPGAKVLCMSAAFPDPNEGFRPENFLAKPFSLKGLVRTVREILGEHSQTKRRDRKVS